MVQMLRIRRSDNLILKVNKMPWTFIAGLLKYWKVLLLVITVGIGGYLYWNNIQLKEANQDMYSTIQMKNADILDLQSRIERERQQSEREYNALEDSIETYQKSLDTSKETNRILRDKLEGVNNDQLQMCLNSELPADILDGLSK